MKREQWWQRPRGGVLMMFDNTCESRSCGAARQPAIAGETPSQRPLLAHIDCQLHAAVRAVAMSQGRALSAVSVMMCSVAPLPDSPPILSSRQGEKLLTQWLPSGRQSGWRDPQAS